MFKLLHYPIQALQCIAPCQLCQTAAQQHSSLCLDCWQQLPWHKQRIQRHEIEIQVACDYRYPLDRIIQQFKYEEQLQYQTLLAGILLALKFPKVHAIVPMPISEKRLIERGYNQVLVLAKILSQQLNIPVWQPISRLHQHSQKGLDRLERLANISEQFEIDTPPKLRYRRVLILDDVVTTGSSIHALAEQLKQLGCEQIYAACIASAEP